MCARGFTKRYTANCTNHAAELLGQHQTQERWKAEQIAEKCTVRGMQRACIDAGRGEPRPLQRNGAGQAPCVERHERGVEVNPAWRLCLSRTVALCPGLCRVLAHTPSSLRPNPTKRCRWI